MIVPKKILFYCRQKGGDGVYPVFPVDAEASQDTAKRWAEKGYYKWDSELRKSVKKEEIEVKVFEYDNEGFGNITIEDIDIRGHGGRAYRVIIEVEGEKFRVDLREDTLMDVINLKGIQAGGRLNGTFCFTKNSGQTNLILEGTERHKDGVAEREKRENNQKVIKKSELQVGHLYETITGNGAVFIGHIYAVDVNRYTGDVSRPYRAMLWLMNGYNNIQKDHEFYNKENYLPNREKIFKDNINSVVINKSHNYRIDKGQVLNDINIDTYIRNTKVEGEVIYDKYKEMNKENDEGHLRGRIARGYQHMTIEKERKDMMVNGEIVF